MSLPLSEVVIFVALHSSLMPSRLEKLLGSTSNLTTGVGNKSVERVIVSNPSPTRWCNGKFDFVWRRG